MKNPSLARLLCLLLLFLPYSLAQKPDTEQLFNQAMSAQQHGDLNAAIDAYERVLKIAPDLVPARANLAAAQLLLGHIEDGIANYRIALRLSYGNPQLGLLLADAFVSVQRYSEAIAVLQPIEKRQPQNLDVAFLMGEALIDNGQQAQGLRRIERVASARDDINAWTLAALTQLKMGDSVKANASAEAAVRLNPSDPAAYVLSGMAKAANGDPENAKAAYRRAVQLDPNDFEANLRLGTLMRVDGDITGAKPHLESALKINPASLSARFEMAQIEISEGRDADAVADLEQIVQRDPKLPQPHIRLAVLYSRMHREQDSMRERQIVDRLQGLRQMPVMEDPIASLENTGVNGPAPSR